MILNPLLSPFFVWVRQLHDETYESLSLDGLSWLEEPVILFEFDAPLAQPFGVFRPL